MSARHNEFIDLVRDWTNRDSSALSDSVIESCLRYAADEAYKLAKIPPLEFTTFFLVTEDGALPTISGSRFSNVQPALYVKANDALNYASVPLPSDTTSFIYLRNVGKSMVDGNGDLLLDTAGNPFVESRVGGTVFNEKTDIRTFLDPRAEVKQENIWSRKGDHVLVAGDLQVGDIVEMHYYRRLQSLNSMAPLPLDLTLAEAQGDTDNYEVIEQVAYDALTSYEKAVFTEISGSYVKSKNELPNWFRDENERVILFGALFRAFDYLLEDAAAAKYQQRFYTAIEELNAEEKRRHSSGGNIAINFNGRGLL